MSNLIGPLLSSNPSKILWGECLGSLTLSRLRCPNLVMEGSLNLINSGMFVSFSLFNNMSGVIVFDHFYLLLKIWDSLKKFIEFASQIDSYFFSLYNLSRLSEANGICERSEKSSLSTRACRGGSGFCDFYRSKSKSFALILSTLLWKTMRELRAGTKVSDCIISS